MNRARIGSSELRMKISMRIVDFISQSKIHLIKKHRNIAVGIVLHRNTGTCLKRHRNPAVQAFGGLHADEFSYHIALPAVGDSKKVAKRNLNTGMSLAVPVHSQNDVAQML